jgi:hypothetical protein
MQLNMQERMNESNNIGGGLGRKEEKRWIGNININLPKSKPTIIIVNSRRTMTPCWSPMPTDKI